MDGEKDGRSREEGLDIALHVHIQVTSVVRLDFVMLQIISPQKLNSFVEGVKYSWDYQFHQAFKLIGVTFEWLLVFAWLPWIGHLYEGTCENWTAQTLRRRWDALRRVSGFKYWKAVASTKLSRRLCAARLLLGTRRWDREEHPHLDSAPVRSSILGSYLPRMTLATVLCRSWRLSIRGRWILVVKRYCFDK